MLSAIIIEVMSRISALVTLKAPTIAAMRLAEAIVACRPDIIITTTIESHDVAAICGDCLASRNCAAVLTVIDDGRSSVLASTKAKPRLFDDLSPQALAAVIRYAVDRVGRKVTHD